MCECQSQSVREIHDRLTLENIFKAQIRLAPYLKETPVQLNTRLSEQVDSRVYLKREDLHPVRSFKIRGALNCILQLSDKQKNTGVVCASAGNHGQGVAFACRLLNIQGKVFLPVSTPEQKVQQVKYLGGAYISVTLVGDSFDECYAEAFDCSNKSGMYFVHPFDDAEVICGQATIALELISSLRTPLDRLYVPVGGGGLMSGIAIVMKTFWPNTKLIGVEAEGSHAMYLSLNQHKRVLLSALDTFADGTAVATVGEKAFCVCQRLIDSIVTVTPEHTIQTLYQLNNEHGIIVEPSGALSVAAITAASGFHNERVGAVLSGGNNDVRRFAEYEQRLSG